MQRLTRLFIALALLAASGPLDQAAGQARVFEEVRTLATYPFSDPNPIPILVRDARLYPYHSFDGYAARSEPRDWRVVVLENDYIEVFVLPEVGGKVWGAVVKESGHEFIYRNEVMKFRNIALRGPWTSGGIEFNFGVIGHTPATATPVDYTTRQNDDGSASVFVGAMDLPSRTHWRVEVRLPADAAYFETRALWYNPTPLAQPYYNWMTAAAFAQDDLVMAIPGDRYLQHSGAALPWPIDSLGRDLARYANNRFEGNKSYHVVGELNDFFGGYYERDDYGFGHWARYEEMPGQKLWLWALSRQGGIWEDLLTDTDGQYIEFQAGRLFVQYQPGDHVNPITEADFDPMSASRWTETWFPLEGTGGLSDASREGAMYVEHDGSAVSVTVSAFVHVSDTVRIHSGDRLVAAEPMSLAPLERFNTSVVVAPDQPIRVTSRALRLDYRSDRGARDLARPFATDPAAVPSIPAADRAAFGAGELMKGRRYASASVLLEEALAAEPWHRGARLGAAELAFRAGLPDTALAHVDRVLEIDAYDAEANFLAGAAYRALGRLADARDALGWATRATGTRSAAYVQLARIALLEEDFDEAERYARLAIDFDRRSVPAWRTLAALGRLGANPALWNEALGELTALDPLHHFVGAERYLAGMTPADAEAFAATLGGEYPEQSLLEIAIEHASLGQHDAAAALLALPGPWSGGPLLRAWRAYLGADPGALREPGEVAFAFPFRRETLDVLTWAASESDLWQWRYLRGLNLWAVGRHAEAADELSAVGDEPDFAPFYVARGRLLSELRAIDALPDHFRAVALAPNDRLMHVALAQELEAQGRWTAALTSLADARARFPDDFNLALFEARASFSLGRARDALEILSGVQVLPSEHARGARQLYSEAHISVALDLMESDRPDEARVHLERALEWPESLGEGRPYEPEERLARFLLGVVATNAGDARVAAGHFTAVADASRRAAGAAAGSSELELLSEAARRILDGRSLSGLEAPDGDGVTAQLVRRAISSAEGR